MVQLLPVALEARDQVRALLGCELLHLAALVHFLDVRVVLCLRARHFFPPLLQILRCLTEALRVTMRISSYNRIFTQLRFGNCINRKEAPSCKCNEVRDRMEAERKHLHVDHQHSVELAALEQLI